MHSLEELGPRIFFRISDQIFITESVFFTWIVMLVLIVASVLLTRNLKERPGKVQALLESGVEMLYGLIEGTVGAKNAYLAPYFVGFLIFTFCCNFLGIVGIRSTTADVNTTFAMGIIAFFMIQGLAIRARTLKGHLHHMSSPYIFLLPVNVISELTLTVWKYSGRVYRHDLMLSGHGGFKLHAGHGRSLFQSGSAHSAESFL